MTDFRRSAGLHTPHQALAVLQPGGPCLAGRLSEFPDPYTEQVLIGAARFALENASDPWHAPRAAVMPDYWLVIYVREFAREPVRVTHAEAFLWAIAVEWEPDQIRRYMAGVNRCKEAMSSRPWYAARAASNPAYWITLCSSEAGKWAEQHPTDRPPPLLRGIPFLMEPGAATLSRKDAQPR